MNINVKYIKDFSAKIKITITTYQKWLILKYGIIVTNTQIIINTIGVISQSNSIVNFCKII